MASAPLAGWAFFPLDEQLALVAGGLTPWLNEVLDRLGAWMPFERAVQLLEELTGARVSEATARRHTEEAGAYLVAVETTEAHRLETEAPLPPAAPAKLALMADGCYVPLVGGAWKEARTLSIGAVETGEQGRAQVRDLSYFSRLLNAQTFETLVYGECHRRGVESARECCAVSDGAEWIQGLVDLHRPDAVRILDFPHAAERVSDAAKAYFGEQSPRVGEFVAEQLHALKHEGPAGPLAALSRMAAERPEAYVIAENLAYLKRRPEQIQYPALQASGWPIGSGAAESANKLVVEARLKGAGMHWSEPHVDPLLALRNAVCNDRWDEAYRQVEDRRRQERLWRKLERLERRAALPPPPEPPVPSPPRPRKPPTPTPAAEHRPSREPRRPAADHPWRRMRIGKALSPPTAVLSHAKL